MNKRKFEISKMCDCCEREIPKGDEPRYVNDENRRGTLEVCKKCEQRLQAKRTYQCDNCNDCVSPKELYTMKERGNKKTAYTCIKCLRYTLLWDIVDAIIESSAYWKFQPYSKVAKKRVKKSKTAIKA